MRRANDALTQLCYICAFSDPGDIMSTTTTIRLPPKLRARLGALAKQTGRSAHSIIVEAVERHAAYEEQIRSLVKEALAADVEIDETGEVYRAEDVHAWMQRLAADPKAQRPKSWQR
jgi:predicted transcriptional regulator